MSRAIDLAAQLTRLAFLTTVAESSGQPGECDLCGAGPVRVAEHLYLCAGCLQARTIDTLDTIKALRGEVP